MLGVVCYSKQRFSDLVGKPLVAGGIGVAAVGSVDFPVKALYRVQIKTGYFFAGTGTFQFLYIIRKGVPVEIQIAGIMAARGIVAAAALIVSNAIVGVGGDDKGSALRTDVAAILQNGIYRAGEIVDSVFTIGRGDGAVAPKIIISSAEYDDKISLFYAGNPVNISIFVSAVHAGFGNQRAANSVVNLCSAELFADARRKAVIVVRKAISQGDTVTEKNNPLSGKRGCLKSHFQYLRSYFGNRSLGACHVFVIIAHLFLKVYKKFRKTEILFNTLP